jgi:hypothetical protein
VNSLSRIVLQGWTTFSVTAWFTLGLYAVLLDINVGKHPTQLFTEEILSRFSLLFGSLHFVNAVFAQFCEEIYRSRKRELASGSHHLRTIAYGAACCFWMGLSLLGWQTVREGAELCWYFFITFAVLTGVTLPLQIRTLGKTFLAALSIAGMVLFLVLMGRALVAVVFGMHGFPQLGVDYILIHLFMTAGALVLCGISLQTLYRRD